MLRQVRGGVDETAPRILVGDGDQLGDIGGALSGATKRNAAAGRLRGGDTTLSTVVRAARNDAGAPQDRGERDIELDSHEAAGRQARNGGLVDIGVKGRELCQ